MTIIITVHHPICGFFTSRKSVHKSGFVHKSGESPQIESVRDFIHTMFILCYTKKAFKLQKMTKEAVVTTLHELTMNEIK